MKRIGAGIGIIFVLNVAIIGAICYVAYHFVTKYW